MKMRIVGALAAIAVATAAAGSAALSGTSQAAPSAADIQAATAPAPPNPEDVFKKECGACHMPYPAGFLPARSWQALTADLAHHFGEDASLDEATTKVIADYLFANAADTPNGEPRLLGGLLATDVPLRITATPWWIRRHHEIPASVFDRPTIKTRSNCLACHGGGAYRD